MILYHAARFVAGYGLTIEVKFRMACALLLKYIVCNKALALVISVFHRMVTLIVQFDGIKVNN